MSADLNKVMIIGRLTRDSELSYTNSGYPFCKFSIAVNRSVKKGESWEEEANFFDLVIWGTRGEKLNQYLTKGTQVGIEGELKQERWEQDGQKRTKVSIEVKNIQLLSSRNSSDGGNSGRSERSNSGGDFRPQTDYSQYQPPAEPTHDSFEDSDIPF